MSIKLNTNTVKKLASPTGTSEPLVQAIFIAEYHKILLSLANLYQKFQSESPDLLFTSTNFSQSFELVKSFSKETQKKILSYPSFSCWLYTAWELANRKAHILFPEMQIKFHLEDFKKFILAMAKYDNAENFECCLYTDNYGRIPIPGMGVYLQHPQKKAFQKLRIVTSNKGWKISSDHEENIAMIQYEIPHLKNAIELNSCDYDLHLGGSYNLEFETLMTTSTIKWLSTLEEAWYWIEECSTLLASEILMGIKSLVPVYSHAHDVHISQTFRAIPGVVILSWMSNTSVIVEALVHEYHHHKLNALLNLDPIIAEGTFEEIYYSPWRNDPRPLDGILQGIYVFQAVLDFWDKFLQADIPVLQENRLKKRVYKLKKQLETALKTLKNHASFSSIGEALIESVEENINQIETEILVADQQLIDMQLKEHQQIWEEKNHHLVKAKIFPITVSAELEKKINQTILNRSFQLLGIKEDIDLRPLTYLRQPFDPILNILLDVYHNQGLKELEDILQETQIGSSILLDLLCGHTAYIHKNYQKAAIFYESCLENNPSAPYFWQCFMFALRHLNFLDDYRLILLNIDTFVAKSEEIKELIRNQPKSEDKVLMMMKLIKNLVG
ncbi:MAG: HEXXH motif-containing putative peptide modification protein [Trichodesmium sp. MAG_R04]|jgi:HEXXH motif-containing protein|nr:HEXXH motif-containing putative peptide modification protein [Trichodesmium sp. MAG_R04]